MFRIHLGILLLLLSFGQATRAQFLLPKLHLAQLPLGQAGIALEKVVDRQFSMQINVQGMWPNKGPNFVNRSFLDKDQIESSSLSGYAASLELRVYTRRARKEAVKMYGGPFLRYARYDMQTSYLSDSLARDLNGSLVSVAGGFQMGVQYIINNRLSIDWTFLGLGYARNELSGKVRTEETEDRPIGKIEDELSGIPLLGPLISLNEEEDALVFRKTYGTLAFRFALTVGLVF